MSKIVTDENQLNTEIDDLITEDYALEILGLKNPADFRKFSRSFMKLSKIVKEIDDSNNNKVDKGGYSGTAQNLLIEISKITSKSVLGRIIIGKGLSVDSSGRTSIVSKNDGITVNENDFQLNTVDNLTTDSGTKPLSARQGKKLQEEKETKIIKKSGFNLEKSDAVNSNDTDTLATSLAVKIAYDKGVEGLDEANKKLSKGNVSEKYSTAEKIGNEVDKKYGKTGGPISGNVVVQGNEIVNGSVSCNSLILNGYTITIE